MVKPQKYSEEANYDFIGFCVNCKDAVMSNDEYVNTRKGIYCLLCYHEKYNIIPELDFE